MDAKVARERLEREKADLAGTVQRIRERLAIPEWDSGGDIALVDDEALARLERREYGRCEVCGTPIPPERLELVPETPFCVDDAEREQARAQ